MPPKKRTGRVGRKRVRSPTPDGDADTPARETRTRSRRVQFTPEKESDHGDFERELQRELEEPLPPDAEIISCYAAPSEESNESLSAIGCPPVSDEESNHPFRINVCPPATDEAVRQRGRPPLFDEPRAPSLFGRNTQQQQPRARRVRHPTDIRDPTPEECLDWYMDAALKEVKAVMRLAGEDKLRQADLWNLLTFGQHMYEGMKSRHGIDLNTALLEREKKNMGTEHLGPEAGLSRLPWPGLPPGRCPTCSRVVAADGRQPGPGEHPWNRTSFARLFPQEDRYDTGGLFGSSPGIPRGATARDPWNIPMRQGTTYAGWNI